MPITRQTLLYSSINQCTKEVAPGKMLVMQVWGPEFELNSWNPWKARPSSGHLLFQLSRGEMGGRDEIMLWKVVDQLPGIRSGEQLEILPQAAWEVRTDTRDCPLTSTPCHVRICIDTAYAHTWRQKMHTHEDKRCSCIANSHLKIWFRGTLRTLLPLLRPRKEVYFVVLLDNQGLSRVGDLEEVLVCVI